MSKSSDKKKDLSERIDIGRFMHILGGFLGDQKSMFTLAGLMLAIEAATAVLVPLIGAFVIDYLTGRLAQIDGKPIPRPLSPLELVGMQPLINPDVDAILFATIGMILLTMVNSLVDSMSEIYLAKGGRRVGYNLRVALYAHLQKLSLAFHDQRRTGDILTRVTSDVAALEDFIISSLSDFVGSILLIVFILTVMILKAWQVALVAAVIIPIMALISNYFTSRIKSAAKKRRASEGELASAAQEMLTSIRVIQTYGMGSYEQSLFAAQSQKAMDASLDAAAYQARFSWVVSVLGAVSTAAIIWMAVYLIFRDPITATSIGILTVYIKYIQDMFKPTKRIIQEWNTFGKLYASVERIGDLMDITPSVQDEPGAVPAPQFIGAMEFRNVYFSYPTIASNPDGNEAKQRTALKNLNFTIEPGQIVAVVGHTGAGKSTIAQLIPRLYDPNSGEVLIDGQDIREYTLDSLRAQISMVLQESILFSGSVVENIAYGRQEATGAEIVAAAKQANAHEFLAQLPEGYYTMLGERGSNLSGGQRQRIAIARAFIRNTPILIMDEPTTGLDAESTDLVLRALQKLMKGKTTIIISHDLNLIRDADKIIVIKAGEIEQMGTHDELIQAGGLYANLYMKQSGNTENISSASLPAGMLKAYPQKGIGQPLKNLSMKSWSGSMDYDLPSNAAFINKIPGLVTAFDGGEMKRILKEVLMREDNEDYSIIDCSPGKAIYLPEQVCSMQYALKIQQTSTGEITRALINARLYPDLLECHKFYKKNLYPLAHKLEGRLEIKPFSETIAIIEPLKMVVSVFPIDGLLPTLIEATNTDRMIGIFKETLPEAISEDFLIEDMHLDLAHYGRFQRCVLRYSLNGQQSDTQTPRTEIVYGKVDADGMGGLNVSVISALRETLRDPTSPYQFRIPHSFGYLPDLKLLLMEALPGEPVIKQLIYKNGSQDGKVNSKKTRPLDDAIAVCAQILATLHSSGIKLGRRHPIQAELSAVKEEIQVMQDVFPELGDQLHSWLEHITSIAMASSPMPLCFSHGDYTYTQLIFDGKEAGLVDFDTVCQAEPALDLGQFLAYQRLAIHKEQDPAAPFKPEEVDRLCDLFLNTYISTSSSWLADEPLLRSRVAVYELLSLIRLALHSWQKLKGSRLKLALQLLEERMECLTRVN